MRCPGESASTLTRVAAFLRCQASWVMVLKPTLTRKPPSIHTHTASRFSPIGVSELLTCLEPEEPIFLLSFLSGIALLYTHCTFSYNIGPHANESLMNQVMEGPPLTEWRGLEDLSKVF